VQNIQNVTPFSHLKKGVTLGVTKGVTPKPAEIKALRALVTPFTPFFKKYTVKYFEICHMLQKFLHRMTNS